MPALASHRTLRPALLPLLLAVAAIIAALAGLLAGPVQVAPQALLAALASGEPLDPLQRATLLQLRLPRVLLALLVGAVLAQTGAAMQGLLRNALAEPGLIGVSGGAALAAAAVYVLIPAGFAAGGPAATALATLGALGGGLLAAWVALRIAAAAGRADVATLLLAGLAINALAGAGIGFLVAIAEPATLRNLSFFSFGSLGKSGWAEIALLAPPLGAVLLWLPREAQALNALLLGDAEALHLGIDVPRRRRRLLALIVAAVAVCIALAGLIGFVGLLVPHMLRLICGPDHRRLLPLSALAGAALLALADLAARFALAPRELPVGVLTALVGGPFFLFLLLRHRRGAVEL